MARYWATGKDTKIIRELGHDWYLEYNSNINMYRLSRKRGPIPLMYMGYSPHKKALLEAVKRG